MSTQDHDQILEVWIDIQPLDQMLRKRAVVEEVDARTIASDELLVSMFENKLESTGAMPRITVEIAHVTSTLQSKLMQCQGYQIILSPNLSLRCLCLSGRGIVGCRRSNWCCIRVRTWGFPCAWRKILAFMGP